MRGTRVGISCSAILLLAMIAATPLAISSSAQEPKKATLADFAWMAGTWKGHPHVQDTPQKKARWAEEEVTAPVNGVMMGMFRLLEGEKTLVLEFFIIRETAEGIDFRFRHFGTEMEAWEKGDPLILKFARMDTNEFTFENPVHSMPKTTTILRTGKDSYTSRSVLIRDSGEKSLIEMEMQRVK